MTMARATGSWGRTVLVALALGAIGCGGSASESSGQETEGDASAASSAAASSAGRDGSSSGATDAASDGPSLPTPDAADATASERNDATIDGASQNPDGGGSGEEAGADSGPEAGTQDAALDASGTGVADASGEGGVPTAILIESGPNFKMRGMTGDGYVVYINRTTEAYFAQSTAAGSSPIPLYTLSSVQQGDVNVLGNLVFISAWQGNAVYAADLTLWSSSLGSPELVSSSAVEGYVWASPDSQHFVYVNVTGVTNIIVGSFVGVDVATNATTTLATNVDLSDCGVSVAFAGESNVLEYCPVTDAALTQNVQAFAFANGWTPLLYVPQVPIGFALDPNGQQVVTASTATLGVFPLDGGPATVLDPTTAINGNTFLQGSFSDPFFVDYTTESGGLMETYVANPSPTMLVDAGVTAIDTLSPNDQWLLTTSQFDSNNNFLDFSLASALNPGALQSVATSTEFQSEPLGLSPSGGIFSTDSSWLFFYSDYGTTSTDVTVGNLYAVSVKAPATQRLISNGTAFDDIPLVGSTVVVLDNFELPDGSTIPTVDLDWFDLSTNNPPTVLATGVPREVAVSKDLTKIAYVVLEGPDAGVYLTTVP